MWLHGSNEFIVHSHIQDIPENGADRGVEIKKIKLNQKNVNLNFPLAHLASVHGPSLMAGTDIRHTHNSCLSVGTHIWDAK